MKKIFLLFSALMLAALFGCQQKDESNPSFQPPIGQTGQGQAGGGPVGGGPIGGGPMQGFDKVKMLQDATAKDPKNINAWIELGNILMDTRRYAEAVEPYKKALELDSKNVDVRVDMGTCLKESGKPDLAVKEYNKALELNPNHVNANKNLAITLMYDLRNPKQALKYMEKALALAPGAPDAPGIKSEIEKIKASIK